MIKFTNEGIFADTEEERELFYAKMNEGNPMIMAHLALYKKELENLELCDGEGVKEKKNG